MNRARVSKLSKRLEAPGIGVLAKSTKSSKSSMSLLFLVEVELKSFEKLNPGSFVLLVPELSGTLGRVQW
jgi:hypothetical protein